MSWDNDALVATMLQAGYAQMLLCAICAAAT
jgi:hypothetical protein